MRCEALTAKNLRCKNSATNGDTLCAVHNAASPDLRRRWHAAATASPTSGGPFADYRPQHAAGPPPKNLDERATDAIVREHKIRRSTLGPTMAKLQCNAAAERGGWTEAEVVALEEAARRAKAPPNTLR